MSRINSINSKEFHIDATPDGKYAARILKCYLERARVKFKIRGMEKESVEVIDYMNECQDKRVKELEQAIKILDDSPHL
jgi:hypothetical protein